MSAEIPIYDGEAVGEEDTQLLALADALEKGQLDFLDQAGARIVQLASALLTVIFGVAAFGDKFPPAYLRNNPQTQTLSVATIGLYLAAIGLGVYAIHPRPYHRYRHNLSRLRAELDGIAEFKARWVTWAGAFFVLGMLGLALLIAVIVLQA